MENKRKRFRWAEAEMQGNTVIKRIKCSQLQDGGSKEKLKRKKVMTLEEKRRIANERERTRVHALSAAFDHLRKVIPCYSDDQRLSKLSILRVAINYIAALGVLNRNAERYADVVRFKQHVNECTGTLQSEYGRAKKRNADKNGIRFVGKRTKEIWPKSPTHGRNEDTN